MCGRCHTSQGVACKPGINDPRFIKTLKVIEWINIGRRTLVQNGVTYKPFDDRGHVV